MIGVNEVNGVFGVNKVNGVIGVNKVNGVIGVKHAIGFVRFESLRPGFVDSRFESKGMDS